jgi:polysaccharide export outer membrane protein
MVIDPEDVSALVVEYRPIYVDGDVFRPGEHPYRPLMTVREAVALAGGYDVTRFRMTNPLFEAAELRGTYQTLWIELAKEKATMWRIKTELGAKDDLNEAMLIEGLVPRATVSDIISVETEHLKARAADYQREKDYLQRSLKQAQEHIAVLSHQEQNEEQGTKADDEELHRVVELFGRGTLPTTRVTDARRAVLLSSSRKLQTSAQLMEVKKEQERVARELEKLDDLHRITLLHELQETNVRVGEIRARLQSTGERLQIAGAMKSPLVEGASKKAQIVVHRKGEEGWRHFGADEDLELQPGDVVDVSLRSDYAVGADQLRPSSSTGVPTAAVSVPRGAEAAVTSPRSGTSTFAIDATRARN